jgi:hypothetical protein
MLKYYQLMGAFMLVVTVLDIVTGNWISLAWTYGGLVTGLAVGYFGAALMDWRLRRQIRAAQAKLADYKSRFSPPRK